MSNNEFTGITGFNGDVDMNSLGKIINLVDPVGAQDGATKNYVDTASGCLQLVSSLLTTSDSTTNTIPNDATIPQQGGSEGKEFTSLAFTPVSASSTLLITVQMQLSNTGTVSMSAPLFVDAVASAISSASQFNGGNNSLNQINYIYKVASASTSARTYRVRFGAGSGTTRVNRNTANDPFQGGVIQSGIIIQEFA